MSIHPWEYHGTTVQQAFALDLYQPQPKTLYALAVHLHTQYEGNIEMESAHRAYSLPTQEWESGRFQNQDDKLDRIIYLETILLPSYLFHQVIDKE